MSAVRPSQARIIAVSTAAPGWFGDACQLTEEAKVGLPSQIVQERPLQAPYPYPIDHRGYDPQGL